MGATRLARAFGFLTVTVSGAIGRVVAIVASLATIAGKGGATVSPESEAGRRASIRARPRAGGLPIALRGAKAIARRRSSRGGGL